jgi:cysteine desulfurase/selenocysteine lyase
MLDVDRIRQDFPALNQTIYGQPLVYFDNAASTQKPRRVIDTLSHHYACDYANVHRGVHYLSQRATTHYEAARDKVRAFVNAAQSREIVFVRGTTEAINLVAQCFARPRLQSGDEILISAMEHHSNIVPWQMVCQATGAQLRVAPVDDTGALLLEEIQRLIGARTRIVAITHVSNALGTVNDVAELVRLAHAHGAAVLVDGAQGLCHLPVDVQALDCDFYAFSGHKLYGPTGIGVLYGKAALLDAMPPYQGGGEMIREVTFEKTSYADIPARFEAGTPHFVGAIGLGAAIDYLTELGMANIADHEARLLARATQQLQSIAGVTLIGTAAHKSAILSFLLDDIHAHDLGTFLDREGIAVRAGHHCAMPVMARFGVPATTRASLALYNTAAEIDALVAALSRAKTFFRRR